MTDFSFEEFIDPNASYYALRQQFIDIGDWCEENGIEIEFLSFAYRIHDDVQAIKFKLRWC